MKATTMAKKKRKSLPKRRCADCATSIDIYDPERTLCGWCRFEPRNYDRGRI